MQTAQDRGMHAVGELTRFLDLGNRAHLGVATVDARDEQDPTVGVVGRGHSSLGLVRIQGERDHRLG